MNQKSLRQPEGFFLPNQFIVNVPINLIDSQEEHVKSKQ